MDFDDLKRVWDECDHKLTSGVRLNTRRLRSIVAPHAEENANRPTAQDIDYTMPVAVARKQRYAHPIIRIVRAAAASISQVGPADQMVGKFEAAVVRMLRRCLTLRD